MGILLKKPKKIDHERFHRLKTSAKRIIGPKRQLVRIESLNDYKPGKMSDMLAEEKSMKIYERRLKAKKAREEKKRKIEERRNAAKKKKAEEQGMAEGRGESPQKEKNKAEDEEEGQEDLFDLKQKKSKKRKVRRNKSAREVIDGSDGFPESVPKGPRAGGRLVTYDELQDHFTRHDAWILLEGSVYDITQYTKQHPGGFVILNAAGKDGTKLFSNIRNLNNLIDFSLFFLFLVIFICFLLIFQNKNKFNLLRFCSILTFF